MTDAKVLVSKLSRSGRRALEKSAALCISKTHFSIELPHLLFVLLEDQAKETQAILSYYALDIAQLQNTISRYLSLFKTGNSVTPALAETILLWLQEAWLQSSLHLNSPLIRTSALFIALFENARLRQEIENICPALLVIQGHELKQVVQAYLATQATDDEGGELSRNTVAVGGESPATPFQDQYCLDLTQMARDGEIDPIAGRESEIKQLVDILVRRRQNNPILTGEPGVGKTAVVEGLALKIASGDVPPLLKRAHLKSLDLGLLEAGAGVKGEFENRLKGLIAEIQKSPEPVILFIDEAHTLIGAGGGAGQNDAANLLKPALARGELRTIAATTWAEYKKYFEKDAALARRFQVVKIDEPDEEAAMAMLRGLLKKLEIHHNVRIQDEAVLTAVRLSHRYMTGRRLPDKAIGVLDTACARVHIAHTAQPNDVVELKAQAHALGLEQETLSRENAVEQKYAERIELIDSKLKDLTRLISKKEKEWQAQKELVTHLDDLYQSLDQNPGDEKALRSLQVKQKQFLKLSDKMTLIPLHVDGQTVAQVIADWTGIPVGKMMKDELNAILALKDTLTQFVKGQDSAIDMIASRLKTYRAHLDTPDKPIGIFLLAGPSGVGKTQTAHALAEVMTGSSKNLIAIHMSEYQESHSVASLRGSPPGYVGYGKGGVLTESVRRNPYSVILLDEIEKAHSDVVELFYQVFDKGVMEDGEGIEIDFKNTIFILTTNVGDALISKHKNEHYAILRELTFRHLINRFPAAFLARLTVVPYLPLDNGQLKDIAALKLAEISQRIERAYSVPMTYEEAVVDLILKDDGHVDAGARSIDHFLSQYLLPELSNKLLNHLVDHLPLSGIHISIGAGSRLKYTLKKGRQLHV
jgi:type VI secretion system protein VasG